MNSEIIKNNIFKYNFIKKFVNGKIFDHQQNIFTTYSSAKILLESNVDEVYSCNNTQFFETDLRKLDNKGNIIFSTINNGNFKLDFDYILSFEILNQKNISENLEIYYKILKENGTLIISVLNKQNKNLEKIQNNYKFSIKELEEKLSPKYEVLEIYSQRFLEKSVKNEKTNVFKIIRKNIAKVLKKIDKNRQFYIKYFQKNISKLDSLNENMKKISDEDYVPKKYDSKMEPFTLILICKKQRQ